MAQAQPDPIPSSSPLKLVFSPPRKLSGLRARRRLLVRGFTAIFLIAVAAIGYLCCLVRVTQVDTACQSMLEECRKKEAEIGGLKIRLSAATDGRTIERFAQRSGFVSPDTVERVPVSPELCRESSSRVARASAWEAPVGSM